MPLEWPFAEDVIRLGGAGIREDDAERQTKTVREILDGLSEQPGIMLCDEVGMGKTYVALAVAASVIVATGGRQPVVVMVPSRLRAKWEGEWQQFKTRCTAGAGLDSVRSGYAHSPTEFFKMLDDGKRRRKHLIFITTGCFSGALGDPWIKLALIRLARRRTRLKSRQKTQIYRWAADLVRLASRRKNLTAELVERLINTDFDEWKDLLVKAELLAKDADDPVPDNLTECEEELRWQPLVAVLRNQLPKRDSTDAARRRARLKDARSIFNKACQDVYKDWIRCAARRDKRWPVSPLLILDEAHHAKNDETRLAKLFRDSSEEDVGILAGKFQRMLFLTATPFQLGHEELVRVLQSFKAIRWGNADAPTGDEERFGDNIGALAKALDANRRAGRHLDRLWGTIRAEMLDGLDVEEWWRRVEARPADDFERRLVEAVVECRTTRDKAQELLHPWLIRHNRPANMASKDGQATIPRRIAVVGRDILQAGGNPTGREIGLPIARDASLPFLLTARAQGELSRYSGARAYFAEGLASSYEAFHHTREDRQHARDMDDDGLSPELNGDDGEIELGRSSTEWYEQQIEGLIPARGRPRTERFAHPKVSATIKRVVDLWAGGEKVLVFCFYRQTCRALYEHIREEVHDRMLRIAGAKVGDDLGGGESLNEYLDRVAGRFADVDSPFHNAVEDLLSQHFQTPRYQSLPKEKLIEVLAAYFHQPSFVARYLPLGDLAVRRALKYGERSREAIEPGVAALKRAVAEQADASNLTFHQRVEQFLDFALELDERGKVCPGNAHDEDELPNPLDACLEAVGGHSRRGLEDQEPDDKDDDDDGHGAFRVARGLVRRVNGDTRAETRERLARAFNSPLFPEILVSSSVMGEGIDLHRFCRHVIHHDGCWNPSTLEQQTGRLDRIRCKAENCGMPIVVHQPFLAGGADEKMYRVVRDRERWFQIVMGQSFQFDEGTSEAIADRVPLPQSLAKELTFDLARWRPPGSA